MSPFFFPDVPHKRILENGRKNGATLLARLKKRKRKEMTYWWLSINHDVEIFHLEVVLARTIWLSFDAHAPTGGNHFFRTPSPSPLPRTHAHAHSLKVKMAAMTTFNPLALSSRACVRGASDRRVVSKASAKTTAAKKAFTVRASDDDAMDVLGEIGLGEEMEDIMAKAAGGRSVPKYIEDLGIEPLTEAFKFLGSDQMTGPGSELLFVEKYGETLYREAGFTPTAELINGRLAVSV